VPTPIAEFSDARAVDRGIGLAATPVGMTVERIADSGGGPLPRSTQVEATPDLPPAWSPTEVAMRPDAASVPPTAGAAAGFLPPGWASWQPGRGSGPDFLAAAGGLALVVLGLRVLLGGRRRERLD
jgi:hypothetical protein